jgi:hypothetical protein
VLEDYHTWKDRRREYDDLSLYAAAEIPVMAGSRCLGVLALARTEPNYRFTAEQIETGILFVRLVALVLDNANLYDSAIRKSLTANVPKLCYRKAKRASARSWKMQTILFIAPT